MFMCLLEKCYWRKDGEGKEGRREKKKEEEEVEEGTWEGWRGEKEEGEGREIDLGAGNTRRNV